jgi:hypothetical protein
MHRKFRMGEKFERFGSLSQQHVDPADGACTGSGGESQQSCFQRIIDDIEDDLFLLDDAPGGSTWKFTNGFMPTDVVLMIVDATSNSLQVTSCSFVQKNFVRRNFGLNSSTICLAFSSVRLTIMIRLRREEFRYGIDRRTRSPAGTEDHYVTVLDLFRIVCEGDT